MTLTMKQSFYIDRLHPLSLRQLNILRSSIFIRLTKYQSTDSLQLLKLELLKEFLILIVILVKLGYGWCCQCSKVNHTTVNVLIHLREQKHNYEWSKRTQPNYPKLQQQYPNPNSKKIQLRIINTEKRVKKFKHALGQGQGV